MTATPALILCIGCGALVPDLDELYSPEHTYLGASPGCWQTYNEVTTRAFSNPGYASAHTLAANTYMVQHPGVPSRQSINSVAIHLIGLYWQLEHNYPADKVIEAMRRAHTDQFVWLDSPASLGPLTIVDIAQVPDAKTHVELVNQWAKTTWDAWQAYHATIRKWSVGEG